MGDQFIALAETEGDGIDDARHFGLVVDDADRVERRLEQLGIDRLDAPGLEFRDPWGNRVQIVDYAEIQFTKADHVLPEWVSRSVKTAAAIDELEEKEWAGLTPIGGWCGENRLRVREHRANRLELVVGYLVAEVGIDPFVDVAARSLERLDSFASASTVDPWVVSPHPTRTGVPRGPRFGRPSRRHRSRRRDRLRREL